MFVIYTIFVSLIMNCESAIKPYIIADTGFYRCFQNLILQQKLSQFPHITYIITESDREQSQTAIFESIFQIGYPVTILNGIHSNCVHYGATTLNVPFMYLMQVDNGQEFIMKLKETISHVRWNPKAKFIIIIREFSRELIGMLLSKLWAHYAGDASVLFQKNNGDVLGVTWFPYQQDDCGKSIKDLHIIACCDRQGNLKNDINLFPEKIPIDIHNCPMNVPYISWPPSVIDPESKVYPGYEVDIMNLVAKVSGVNFKFIRQNGTQIGSRSPNGSWSKVLGELQNHSGEIVFGCIENNLEKHLDFELSKVYAFNSIIWVVPSAPLSNAQYIFRAVFNASLWCLLVTTISLMGVILWLFSSLHQERDEYSLAFAVGTNLLRLFTCESMPYGPASTTVRVFYIFCFFSSVILTTYYNAMLYSLLTYPSYETEINSLEELLDSGIRIGLFPIYEELFSVNDSLNNRVLQNFVKCTTIHECMREVSKGDFATVCDRFLYVYYESNYSRINGKSLFHIFPIRQYHVSAVARKGFPLMNRFDEIIYRIPDFGFANLYLSRRFNTWLSLRNIFKDRDKEEHLYVNMDHLSSIFWLHLWLLLISYLVFVLEVICRKIFNCT